MDKKLGEMEFVQLTASLPNEWASSKGKSYKFISEQHTQIKMQSSSITKTKEKRRTSKILAMDFELHSIFVNKKTLIQHAEKNRPPI